MDGHVDGTVVSGSVVDAFVLWLDLLDHGVEPMHVVGRVLNHSGGTVRLDQAVRALDGAVSVAHFVLALHVAGDRIVYRILEVVRAGALLVVLVLVVLAIVATSGAVQRGDERVSGDQTRGRGDANVQQLRTTRRGKRFN